MSLSVLWIMWEQTAEDNINLAKQNAVVHDTKPHILLQPTSKPDDSVWVAPPDLSVVCKKKRKEPLIPLG